MDKVIERLHTDATRAVENAVRLLGGRSYFVGGCVRDRVMGREPKDRDMLVTGVPKETLASGLPGRVDLVGKSFGVFKCTLFGETVDVALPRTERSTGEGHRDFEVQSDHTLPVERDLARRDFTMNAMALEALTGDLVDPFGGMTSLEQGVIRAVGRPIDRFAEDPLRMLRAVRFSSTLLFDIAEATSEGIQANATLLSAVSPERVYEEMCRLLMGKWAANGTYRLTQLGLMDRIVPEFAASVGFHQHNVHHDRTVDAHVRDALSYAVQNEASLRARWAVLLHDIAKPRTFTLTPEGIGHFYDHDEVGAAMAAEILGRLKAPTDMVLGVARLVNNHLRPPHEASDRVLRRFTADMGDLTEDALMVRESDASAHAGPSGKYIGAAVRASEVRSYRERIKAFAAVTGFTEAKLALKGDEIARLFQVQGAAIGRLKRFAAAAVVEGTVENEQAALVRYLELNKERA
jgi:tRNA nucleotidyltransferase (CCA-adding enzyme)